MRFEIVNVTPELAAKFLGKNDGNRKLREHRSAYLSRAILEGKWKLTHQAAAISKKGRLLDGQHRFRAICLANKSAEMVIAYDVPEDVFAVMDAGMPRQMHERLRSDWMKANKPSCTELTLKGPDFDLIRRWPKAASIFSIHDIDGVLHFDGFVLKRDKKPARYPKRAA